MLFVWYTMIRPCVAVSDNTWYVMKLCSTFVSRNRFLTSGKQSTHPTWPHGIYCILTGVGVEWTNRKFLPNSTIVKKCLDYSFWLMVGAKAPVRLTLKMLCKCTWTSKNIEGNSDHKHRCQSTAWTANNCNANAHIKICAWGFLFSNSKELENIHFLVGYLDCINWVNHLWFLHHQNPSFWKQFWVFSRKITISIISKNTQNCFAYNSATKCRSEAVLYSKRTAGCPLSPHIKTIAVAFLLAE